MTDVTPQAGADPRRRRFRRFGGAAGLLLLAAAIAPVGSAGAAVSGLCGTVVQVPAPPSLVPGAFEDSSKFRLVTEATERSLATPLAVDITGNGLFETVSELSTTVIAAGTPVNSYLLHADPVGAPQPGVRMTATLGFDTDILVVQVTDAVLALGDKAVGAVGTAYPGTIAARGLEIAPHVDFVQITGSRTFQVSVLASTVADEVRIITSAAPDQGPKSGYQMIAADGGVFSFGNRTFKGSAAANPPHAAIVASAMTCTGKGYWLAESNGEVLAFGDAGLQGSLAGTNLNQPIVAMATTPTSGGYWLAASDGGVFNFGDAPLHGSMGNKPLNQPIVAMASTPSGDGYWLAASDGGIFSFGDAEFHGSTGDIKLNQPIVGMAATPSGHGYWLVASDGGIFSFGDAAFYGSTGSMKLNRPVVDMVVAPSSQGYWLVASDGGVFSFGDAPFYGSMGATPLNQPIVAAL